jgi:hypothetical protein
MHAVLKFEDIIHLILSLLTGSVDFVRNFFREGHCLRIPPEGLRQGEKVSEMMRNPFN